MDISGGASNLIGAAQGAAKQRYAQTQDNLAAQQSIAGSVGGLADQYKLKQDKDKALAAGNSVLDKIAPGKYSADDPVRKDLKTLGQTVSTELSNHKDVVALRAKGLDAEGNYLGAQSDPEVARAGAIGADAAGRSIGAANAIGDATAERNKAQDLAMGKDITSINAPMTGEYAPTSLGGIFAPPPDVPVDEATAAKRAAAGGYGAKAVDEASQQRERYARALREGTPKAPPISEYERRRQALQAEKDMGAGDFKPAAQTEPKGEDQPIPPDIAAAAEKQYGMKPGSLTGKTYRDAKLIGGDPLTQALNAVRLDREKTAATEHVSPSQMQILESKFDPAEAAQYEQLKVAAKPLLGAARQPAAEKAVQDFLTEKAKKYGVGAPAPAAVPTQAQPAAAQTQKFKDALPGDTGTDYDYAAAEKAGVSRDANGHMPDTFKKPNHPTFSTDAAASKQYPDLAGTWNGDQYAETPAHAYLMRLPPDKQAKFLAMTPEQRAAVMADERSRNVGPGR